MKTPSRARSLHSFVSLSLESLAALGLVVAVSACGSSTNESGFSDAGGASPPSDGGHDDATSSQGDDDAGNTGPMDTGVVTGVIAVPLTACTPLVYSANVAIGTQDFTLLVDTGSTSLGVSGMGCTNCDVTPLYTPGPSATDENTPATETFGSGNWSGEVYQDSVGFEGDPSVPVKLISITSQTGFIQPGSSCGGTPYEGLMGFDRASAAVAGTNAFFDQFVSAKGIPNVFATELCDNGGTLWLGGFDSTATTAAPQYTPVTTDIDSTYYYTVDLESMKVGGTSVTVPISTGSYTDSVLDTGTSGILLGTDAYNSLTAAIAGTAGFAQIFGADAGPAFFGGANPGCANLTQTKAELDATLPPLTLTFGTNPAITVQALATESYLMPYAGMGWCSSLVLQPQSDEFPLASLLGSPILRSNVVIFDRANGRIGFAPHAACPN